MKICTVVGARPQFIKAAPVMRALSGAGCQEVLIHTGQHYDYKMSDIFFKQLDIRSPDYHLGVGSGTHGAQTGQMLAEVEKVLAVEKPDTVLVYGDTNTTLAGALAAAKLSFPVAHVEAGIRSYNRSMPEEINRVLTDHISDTLFCPSQTAVDNLTAEGIRRGVVNVGDVMYDALLYNTERAEKMVDPLSAYGLAPGGYFLLTLHRPINTDHPETLADILAAFSDVELPVVFPAHPRTKKVIEILEMVLPASIHLMDPVGYLEMLLLVKNARVVLTDSGGVQKEAYWNAVPCVTIRTETEWPETLKSGWNTLASPDKAAILEAVHRSKPSQPPAQVYGDGYAAQRIADYFISQPG